MDSSAPGDDMVDDTARRVVYGVALMLLLWLGVVVWVAAHAPMIVRHNRSHPVGIDHHSSFPPTDCHRLLPGETP